MLDSIDRISDLAGQLAAWLFFAIGGMLTYEVVARYLFLAPTIWAEEMSRFVQIWATYLAAAMVLRRGDLISIRLLVDHLGASARRWADSLSLLAVAGFCLVAIWYGGAIVLESIVVGRATSTMMSVPQWMTETAVPLGFALLLAQALADLVRLWREPPSAEAEEESGR